MTVVPSGPLRTLTSRVKWRTSHSPWPCSTGQPAWSPAGSAAPSSLTWQCSAPSPAQIEQPAVPGAVPDRVGRQFVDGADDLVEPEPGQAGLGGVRGGGRPQRVQRVRVERLVQQHRVADGRAGLARVTRHG